MTRARDVADTQDNVGGAVAPVSGGKNWFINGAQEIDQRNNGSSTTVNAALKYGVDRWFLYNSSATNATVQRVTGTNTGTQYAARITGSWAGNYAQRMESNQVAGLAGKTVTVSGTIYGSTTITGFSVYAIFPTAQDNYAGTTNITSGNSIFCSTTTSTFSVTFTLPSGVVNGLEVGITGSLGAGVYFDVSNLQIEVGSKATPFSRAGGSIGGELALCQRYYYAFAVGADKPIGVGYYNTSTNAQTVFKLPVTMRTNPTLVATTGTSYYQITAGGVDDTFNSLTIFNVSTESVQLYNNTEVSGTIGYAGQMKTINASASAAFSAEL